MIATKKVLDKSEYQRGLLSMSAIAASVSFRCFLDSSIDCPSWISIQDEFVSRSKEQPNS
jgi:hypothetical protein